VSVVVISKDEPALAGTLSALVQGPAASPWSVGEEFEVVVVDASDGRLDYIRDRFSEVRWAPFRQPPGRPVTIALQRNAGVAGTTGEVVVFTDAGCLPADGWLPRLVYPITSGEELMTCGPARDGSVYQPGPGVPRPRYVEEAPTINLAVHRDLFDRIGYFDPRFSYGSDIDFTWRARDAGVRIRVVDGASVVHDWGSLRRQLKRSIGYGRARARLYEKHRSRIVPAIRHDPAALAYPLYILGLPIAWRNWRYLLLLAVPLVRARRYRYPVRVVAEHLAQGVGCLQEVGRMMRPKGDVVVGK